MKKVLVVIFIVAVISGISAYFLLKEKPEECKIENIFETRKEYVRVDDGRRKVSFAQYNVNAVFPKFGSGNKVDEKDKSISYVGLKDSKAANEINRKIEEAVEPYIRELEVIVDIEEEVSEDFTYSYDVSYKRYDSDKYKKDGSNTTQELECKIINTEVETARYVSLVVNHEFTTRGLRSNNWKETYVVDVENSKLLTLADICDFNNYKESIIREINRQAKEKNIKLLNGNDLKDISDNQKFYINDEDKLVIYFEPAAITAYKASMSQDVEFEMPFKLKDHKFVES